MQPAPLLFKSGAGLIIALPGNARIGNIGFVKKLPTFVPINAAQKHLPLKHSVTW